MIYLPQQRTVFNNFSFSLDDNVENYNEILPSNIKLNNVNYYDYDPTSFLKSVLREENGEKIKSNSEHIKNIYPAKYLCEVSGILDAKNYTIKGKGLDTEAVLDKNIHSKFNQVLSEIQKIDNELDKFRLIHSLYEPETEFQMVSKKELVDSSFADVQCLDYTTGFDEEYQDTHISSVEINIKLDMLNINDFVDNRSFYISNEDNEVLNPVFKKLGLDDPDNYSPEIVQGYYGQELAGFNINSKDMDNLAMIANKVVLANGLEEKTKLVDDFINDKLDNTNKFEEKPVQPTPRKRKSRL